MALRPRHSPYPMLSVDEALHVISQNTPSHLLTEQKSIVGVFILFWKLEEINSMVHF